MGFCGQCQHRSARCYRRCDREADGKHLWQVVQDDLARARGGSVSPHLVWERQSGDVRQAYIVGAEAMHTMER